MKKLSFNNAMPCRMLSGCILLFLCLSFPLLLHSQIILSIKSDTNKLCDGNGCNYTGPTILINEVMINPTVGDGSLAGTGPPPFTSLSNRGEWIELYNANKCDSIDISCYYLGNTTFDDNQDFGGGYELPMGTVVPPMGFVVLRGEVAQPVADSLLIQNGGNTIEIVVVKDQQVCLDGGYRLWFPNHGGWFAFYTPDGTPQDAIYWNKLDLTNLDGNPCMSNAGCPNPSFLPSFNQINSSVKTYIFSSDPADGKSYGRIPDGGPWPFQKPHLPTMGYCNSICNPPGLSTCTGKLSVTAQGGVPPYSYAWNDPFNQTDDTAAGLCLGYYCVTVTDVNGNTAVICDSVHNFVPDVSLDTLSNICSNIPPFILVGGSPTGGTYTGPGVFQGMFYPDSAGVDTVTITYTVVDEDSCINSASRIFRIFGTPQANLADIPSLCDNSQPVDFTSQVPTGGVLSGIGLIGNVFHPSLAGIGLFEITLTVSNQEGCVDKDTIKIVVNSSPTANAFAPDTFCVTQDPVVLDFGTPPGGVYFINQVQVTVLYPDDFNVGTYESYYIYQSVYNSCTDTAFFPVIIRPAPEIILKAEPTLICQGQACVLSATGAKEYQWNTYPGKGSQFSVYPNYPSVYYVTGSDAPGCFDIASVRVEVAPTLWFDLGPSHYELFGNSIKLNGPPGADRYLWSTGSTERYIVVNEEDTYWLLVETDHSYTEGDITCPVSDTVFVGITGCVFVPDAFTPNGDGKNEIFLAKCGFELETFEMLIFDRWGGIIYKSNDINAGWDGSNKGEICPYGIYTCVVRFTSPAGQICSQNQVVKTISLLR